MMASEEESNRRREDSWHIQNAGLVAQVVNQVVAQVSANTELQILRLKGEILSDLPNRLDLHFEQRIGSSSSQHVSEHEQLRQVVKTLASIKQVIIVALVTAILGTATVAMVKTPAASPIVSTPPYQERHITKPIRVPNE